MATATPPVQQHPTADTAPCTTVPPNLTLPLVNEPAQSCPTDQVGTRGPLDYLIGTWTNQDLVKGKGGPASPFSYNLMVLPQTDPKNSPEGYILKNMSYYEEITFSPIHGNAANRGGQGVQVSNALFYEQRIYISQISGTPVPNTLVHAENGSWLFLSDSDQFVGPYPGPTSPKVPGSKPPTQPFNLVKQIAVPHGNSVLALGKAAWPPVKQIGPPSIPVSKVLPSGVGTGPYTTKSQGNPNLAYTKNPNQALVDALKLSNVGQYIMLHVSSASGAGAVTNIGFEQQHANVERYTATYWLEALAGSQSYDQLQYSQTIVLKIPIGKAMVLFPHITTNTLRRVKR